MHTHADGQPASPTHRSAAERPRSATVRQFAAEPSAANHTGLPDGLKAGVESLSGQSLDHVRVHRNSAKPAQLNAHAYAQGSEIHVAPGQEKHLPHEAWHVVQQAQGRVKPTMQLRDAGVPINDDPHLEREADVMGGRAAQRQVARIGGCSRVAGGRVVQRNVTVAGERRYFTRNAWPHVSGLATITNLTAAQQGQARTILDRWIHASAGSAVRRGVVSEDRSYANWQELADALAGEVLSAPHLATENALQVAVHASATIGPNVAAFMARLQAWHALQAAAMQTAARNSRGRYRVYYGASGLSFAFGVGTTIHDGLIGALPATLNGQVTLAADYALFARAHVALGGAAAPALMTPAHTAARSTHWNTNEGAAWTQAARVAAVPLSAGPSASTGQLMRLGVTIAATPAEMEAMAWAIFAFFNHGLDLNLSGTHRFHEVMDVAALYGVPYVNLVYPAAPP